MFDIIGRRSWWFLLSALLVLPGVTGLLLFGLKLGIDFTGGSLLEVRLQEAARPAQVREVLGGHGFPDSAVQTTAEGSVLVRAREMDTPTKEAIKSDLALRFGGVSELQFESIGPVVGAETARRAVLAVAIAALAILVYLWWAFRQVPQAYRYGACAVAALLHDVFLVLGLWSFFGYFFAMEVDSLFVTGILTVVGFSVHDTIVVFDRIRENVTRFREEPFEKIVNFSVNQTLDRSLNTSLTVILTLSALLLFGGVTIRNFVLTLLIGIVTGTYSSIFNASCLLVVWEGGELSRLLARVGGRVHHRRWGTGNLLTR